MNQHYRNVGISFTLAHVDDIWNPTWARGYDELGMKNKLRRGGYADLNIYFVASIPGGAADGSKAAGFCYLPIPRRLDSWELVLDGCVLIAQEVPGVEGWTGRDMAATHEVGHYLGLYHIFESGNRGELRCSPGDDVDDTYPQEEPSHYNTRPTVWACDGWQRSNMYNFMDYS